MANPASNRVDDVAAPTDEQLAIVGRVENSLTQFITELRMTVHACQTCVSYLSFHMSTYHVMQGCVIMCGSVRLADHDLVRFGLFDSLVGSVLDWHGKRGTAQFLQRYGSDGAKPSTATWRPFRFGSS